MSTKTTWTVPVVAIALVGAFVRSCQAAEPVIERMLRRRGRESSERQRRPRSWLKRRLSSVTSAPIATYFAFRRT
jgi:hypothetical protein